MFWAEGKKGGSTELYTSEKGRH